MLQRLVIFVVFVLHLSHFEKAYGQSLSAPRQNLLRTETININGDNILISDLPRAFAQRLNSIKQSRADSAFIHTINLASADCAKTISGYFEIRATALNRGARNDRIGILRNGVSIGGSVPLWLNQITIGQSQKITYRLKEREIASINEIGRLTMAIQDDTRIDSAKLIITRDYSKCRSNAIS